MKSKRTVWLYVLILISIILILNILSGSFYFRADFTEDNRYSLSNATENILESLVEPVTITAYFSEDLPADIAKVRQDFKDLLIEFADLSGGMVVFEFINPNEDEDAEQKAMKSGINPVLVNSREKDQIVQKKAYLGAVVQLGEKSEIIPFIQPDAAMEYALSTSIKKLSIIDKPTVGILQGHGEPTIQEMQQTMASLSILYDVEPVSLDGQEVNLDKYSTIAIIAPKDSFPNMHFSQLDNFLSKGKNLFVAINRVDGDLSTAAGSAVTTGLETWLSQKGLQVESNFVVDAKCANVSIPQRFGNMTINAQAAFPYIPIISTFDDHPITKGLESVILQFVSSVSYSGDTSMTFTPLIRTSEKSGTIPCPTFFDVRKRWSEADFPLKSVTLGGVLSGGINGNPDSRIVLIADGNFPVNGEGREFMQLQPDNVSLMVNSIDWLSDDTGLIELRTKGVSSRPLDEISDSSKLILKIVNILLPMIFLIIFGIIRTLQNKNKRVKRMEEGYV